MIIFAGAAECYLVATVCSPEGGDRSVATRKSNGKSKSPRDASTYRHPEADSPMRPEVGTQAQFKKRKPPATYRYDSSLSPALDWDGQNHAREAGEALIREIIDAKSLEDAQAPQRSGSRR